MSEIGEKEKIAILALEYTSLRTEINSRISSSYQVAAIFSAVTVWAAQQPWNDQLIAAGAIAGVGFSLCVWFLLRDSMKATFRVQDLEKEINRRAGEKLLIWENELGGLPHGYLQIRYFFRLLAARRRPEAS